MKLITIPLAIILVAGCSQNQDYKSCIKIKESIKVNAAKLIDTNNKLIENISLVGWILNQDRATKSIETQNDNLKDLIKIAKTHNPKEDYNLCVKEGTTVLGFIHAYTEFNKQMNDQITALNTKECKSNDCSKEKNEALVENLKTFDEVLRNKVKVN